MSLRDAPNPEEHERLWQSIELSMVENGTHPDETVRLRKLITDGTEIAVRLARIAADDLPGYNLSDLPRIITALSSNEKDLALFAMSMVLANEMKDIQR